MKAVVFPATEQLRVKQDCCRSRLWDSVDDMTAMAGSVEQDPL